MRGDVARLARCTAVTTQSEDTIKRSKPFKYAYEKEIVMYVHVIRSGLIRGTALRCDWQKQQGRDERHDGNTDV
jgi:hypothetical protein